MGKIKSGIFSGVSGKVGGLIGSSWKGIAYLKQMPQSVANPQTAKQVAQRTKMANVVAFSLAILSTIIKPLWERGAKRMSGFNSFVQTNIAQFVSAMPSSPLDLIISMGKIDATPITNTSLNLSSGEFTLSWTNDSGQGLKLSTDVLYCVLVNITKSITIGFETTVMRSAATITQSFDKTGMSAGDICYLYMAFKRADGLYISNSSSKLASSEP